MFDYYTIIILSKLTKYLNQNHRFDEIAYKLPFVSFHVHDVTFIDDVLTPKSFTKFADYLISNLHILF